MTKHQEVLKWLVDNGKYKTIWPFASGGKKPANISYYEIKDTQEREQIKNDVETIRKNENKPIFNSMTWGDYTILAPKYKVLRDITEQKIINSDVQAISIKLGPTHPDSDLAIFSIDLDCKENIITGEPYPEDIRQPFLDKIVKTILKLYGTTTVTGSRGNGRHILYKTSIKQGTKVTNSTNNLMGLYWNNNPDYLFAVDYKTSPSWFNRHHTTIFGKSKDGQNFGLLMNYPIRTVPKLQTNQIIIDLLNMGVIQYSKELEDERRAIRKWKTLETRIKNNTR